MTKALKPAELRAKDEHYRATAKVAYDQRIVEPLLELADEYEATADRIENDDQADGLRNRSADGEES